MSEPIEVWAFWRYDIYPYVHGGRVTQTNDDGSVFVEGWGNSTWHPRLLIAGKAGEEFHTELYRLRIQYEAKERELRMKFKNSARAVFDNFHVSYRDFPPLARSDVEEP